MVSVVANAVKGKKKNQGKNHLKIKIYPLKQKLKIFLYHFCPDLLDLYEKASKGGKVSLESLLELAENHDIQVRNFFSVLIFVLLPRKFP